MGRKTPNNKERKVSVELTTKQLWTLSRYLCEAWDETKPGSKRQENIEVLEDIIDEAIKQAKVTAQEVA